VAGGGSRSPSEGVESGEKININTATIEELDTLPGIGPGYAQRIVEYREVNGPFSSVEEIILVSGIGDATFEKIKDRITVGD
jgi:competence protein ComEA